MKLDRLRSPDLIAMALAVGAPSAWLLLFAIPSLPFGFGFLVIVTIAVVACEGAAMLLAITTLLRPRPAPGEAAPSRAAAKLALVVSILSVLLLVAFLVVVLFFKVALSAMPRTD